MEIKTEKISADVINLGEKNVPSPLQERFQITSPVFIHGHEQILYNINKRELENEYKTNTVTAFEKGGPRKKIYFDPSKVKSAIVTCGGLCPGLNDVIRSVVRELWYGYGARNIIGIPYGYTGLDPMKKYKPVELNPDMIDDIHKYGGTILGSSRGGTDNMEMLVDSLERMNINILFTVGGDGTLRGSHRISEIAMKRNYKLSVIGIPKTIDNDISYVERSFGFETSFSKAVEVISCAHTEAKGAPNGIGLVKLMGRHSGFIAAHAALASGEANFVLVPEIPFDLDGDKGFLATLEKRLIKSGHAVVCVAEGAGQDLMINETKLKETDASGNVRLDDIGVYLKTRINTYFAEKKMEANLKYIDPSYTIRSAPANPNDSLLCGLLGQYAVHAGMAGKTDMLVGLMHGEFIHVPIPLAVSKRKQIDPDSRLWYDVLLSTGQLATMKN